MELVRPRRLVNKEIGGQTAWTPPPPRQIGTINGIWLRLKGVPQVPESEPCSFNPQNETSKSIFPTAAKTAVVRPLSKDAGPSKQPIEGPIDPASKSALPEDASGISQVPVDNRHRAIEQTSPEKCNVLETRVQTSKADFVTPIIRSQVMINGHCAFYLADNCYAVPTLTVPTPHLELWRHQLNPRLESEILHVFRKERCQLEFLMFAKEDGQTEPGILLTCKYEKSSLTGREREKFKRKVQKKVNKFESLRTSPFPCRVMIDNNRLLTLAYWSEGTGCKVCQGSLPDMTMCGKLLRYTTPDCDEARYCTLGGLIITDNVLYGLTVNHPFDPVHETDSNAPSNRSTSSLSILSTDSEGSRLDISPAPNIYRTEIADSVVHSSGRPSALADQRHKFVDVAECSHGTHGIKQSNHYNDVGTVLPTESSLMAADAALVSLSEVRSCYPPNRYQKPGESIWTTITTFAFDLPESSLISEVFVLCGISGVLPARLGQKDINLNFNGQRFSVAQIILNQSLLPGDSGSWVVQGNRLIGYIISGREIMPWAYMMPISILQEILPTDIGLPTEVPPELHSEEDPEDFYRKFGDDQWKAKEVDAMGAKIHHKPNLASSQSDACLLSNNLMVSVDAEGWSDDPVCSANGRRISFGSSRNMESIGTDPGLHLIRKFDEVNSTLDGTSNQFALHYNQTPTSVQETMHAHNRYAAWPGTETTSPDAPVTNSRCPSTEISTYRAETTYTSSDLYHLTLKDMLHGTFTKPEPSTTPPGRIDELLEAILLVGPAKNAYLHSRQTQLRRDHPHEIALLRTEATAAGFNLRSRAEKTKLRNWLEEQGDDGLTGMF